MISPYMTETVIFIKTMITYTINLKGLPNIESYIVTIFGQF